MLIMMMIMKDDDGSDDDGGGRHVDDDDIDDESAADADADATMLLLLLLIHVADLACLCVHSRSSLPYRIVSYSCVLAAFVASIAALLLHMDVHDGCSRHAY